MTSWKFLANCKHKNEHCFASITKMRNYNTNSKVKLPGQLQPEQRRVFEELRKNFVCWQLQTLDIITEEILLTGSTYFTEVPVTMNSIPSGATWNWRQSNAKVSVKLDVTTYATMIKLNTTKMDSNSPKPPSYKFWIVQIEQSYQQHIWFLYCERGLQQVEQKEEDPFPVSLSDLQFLRPFLNETTATSIWNDLSLQVA